MNTQKKPYLTIHPAVLMRAMVKARYQPYSTQNLFKIAVELIETAEDSDMTDKAPLDIQELAKKLEVAITEDSDDVQLDAETEHLIKDE